MCVGSLEQCLGYREHVCIESTVLSLSFNSHCMQLKASDLLVK